MISFGVACVGPRSVSRAGRLSAPLEAVVKKLRGSSLGLASRGVSRESTGCWEQRSRAFFQSYEAGDTLTHHSRSIQCFAWSKSYGVADPGRANKECLVCPWGVVYNAPEPVFCVLRRFICFYSCFGIGMSGYARGGARDGRSRAYLVYTRGSLLRLAWRVLNPPKT